MSKYDLPIFLEGRVESVMYAKWLDRKASVHFKRDSIRGYEGITKSSYKMGIHAAVVESQGKDYYTGEELDWQLLSKYNNGLSKAGRHEYKASFALLPTVDHIDSSKMNSGFCICSWRTNDAKHDLTYAGFIDVCIKVLRHSGYVVSRNTE